MSKAVGSIAKGLAIFALSFLAPGGSALRAFFRVVGINTALGGIARALTPTPKRTLPSVKGTITGGANSLPLVFGTRRVGGQVCYLGTSGSDREYLHLVVAHSLTASCGVEDITDVYVDGAVISDAAINGSGVVTTGTYAGWIEARRLLGASTDTVDSTFDTAFSDVDSNFRGKGVAKTYFRLYRNLNDDAGFQNVFPRGIPGFSVVLKGQKCYDPRLDSTNGGSGSHRYDVASTWAYSATPALCSSQYLIMESSDGGAGLDPATQVDWVSVAAAASICEENRTIPDGVGGSTTQSRYQCHIVLSTEASREENINRLVSTMAGQWVNSGGKVKLYAGAYTTPQVTITESWLRGPSSLTPKMPFESLWNAVRASFDEASVSWRTTIAKPFTDSTYEAQDGNQRLWKDVTLHGTTDQYQAQYLEAILGRRSRMQAELRLSLNYKGADLLPWDTVYVTLSRFGLSAAVYRIVEWVWTADGPDLTLVEESSSVYASTYATDYVETNPTSTPSYTAEGVPTPLGVAAQGVAGAIVVTWNIHPLDLVTEIHRSDSSGGTFTEIGAMRGTSFTDRVSGGTTRYYKLRYRRFDTNGSFSAEVSAAATATYAIPQFVGAGTAAAATDTGTGEFAACAPAYPASCAVGDLLVIQVGASATNVSFDGVEIDTPSGWTACTKVSVPALSDRVAQILFYKRALGTEVSTDTVTITGRFTVATTPTSDPDNVVLARMYRFVDAVESGDPRDGTASGTATSATVAAQNITTTVDNCLACQFVMLNEDETTASFTGESGTDYTEDATSGTTVGGDIAIQLQSGDKATAGAITGGSYTVSGATAQVKYAFGILPG